MRMNQLGRNGPIVSMLALGAMTFGSETDEDEAGRMLDLFVERGGTFVDTADVYGNGLSEEIIGEWGRRRGGLDALIIATKGRFIPVPGSHGASRRSLTRAVNASLKRLQVEAINIYYVHGWDRDTDVLETLTTLGDFVRAGKIHNIAWSNVTGWQLERILGTARQHGLPVPVAVQPQYNLLDRGIELELLPCCLENEVSAVPWSPLGGGWLTGKYDPATRPTGKTRLGEDPGRGVEAWDLRSNAKTAAVLEALKTIADRHNRPAAHVALAWLSARPGVASLLMGARTCVQLADNLAAADLVLDPSEQDDLTRISATGLPLYPYGFQENWSKMDVWKRLGT